MIPEVEELLQRLKNYIVENVEEPDQTLLDEVDIVLGFAYVDDDGNVVDVEDEKDPFLSDSEADADALASIGWGTDEDYGGTDERM